MLTKSFLMVMLLLIGCISLECSAQTTISYMQSSSARPTTIDQLIPKNQNHEPDSSLDDQSIARHKKSLDNWYPENLILVHSSRGTNELRHSPQRTRVVSLRSRINPTRTISYKRNRVSLPHGADQQLFVASSSPNNRPAVAPNKLILDEDLIKLPTTPAPILVKTNYSLLLEGKLDKRCPKSDIITLENHEFCDKYYRCENGFITERRCPNGLLYKTDESPSSTDQPCAYRWLVSCGDRRVPNPISSPGCLWQNGLFMVQGSPRCSPDYHLCTDGQFKVERCPSEGEVFDDRSKSCKAAGLAGCSQDTIEDFLCPPDDQANPFWPYPRYFLNDQAVVNCINHRPKLIRCRDGERVDSVSLHCGPAESRPKINRLAGEQADELDTRLGRRRDETDSETKPSQSRESVVSLNNGT